MGESLLFTREANTNIATAVIGLTISKMEHKLKAGDTEATTEKKRFTKPDQRNPAMGRGEQVREIKFRAWDGSTMFYDVLAGAGSENVCDFDEDNLVWWWHEPPEAIMEFTGLKDKNGRAIYEGDIIHRFDKHVLSEPPLAMKVYWNQNACGWFLESAKLRVMAMSDLCLLEVIGNIYEHPHLLEQKA